MAERESDPTDPGTGAGGGVPAWLYNRNAFPPPADTGHRWLWYDGDGQPRWIHVPTDWKPPRPATAPPADPNAPPPPGPMTRDQRDALTRGTLGNLEGFMSRASYGADVKARTTVKNMFATIASRYASKPSSIDQILADADFKRLFPNAKKVGFDKIDFGGVKSDFETGTPVGIVDVLTAADPNTDTARGWWWGYDAGGTGPTTYRPSDSGANLQGATGASLPTYDPSRYGREALSKSPEERGWFTLAELGFSGPAADETPEDIFKRNRAASANDNTAQPWDMSSGAWSPKYQPRPVDPVFSAKGAFKNYVLPVGAMIGGVMAGPKLFRFGSNLATLGSLLGGRSRNEDV
jgi:hypothetical protein